jgi:hypothetical protein
MQDINFKQHITFKNLILAFLALNIFSVVSTVNAPMHTFKTVSHKSVEPAAKPAKALAPSPADGDLIAHIMPGEAAAPRAEKPAAVPPRVTERPAAESKPKRPPGMSLDTWMSIAFAFGALLYFRYMMRKAVDYAAGQIKSVAIQSWQALSAKPAAPSPLPATKVATSAAIRQPKLPNASSSRPRGGTVVRPSRWPFGV